MITPYDWQMPIINRVTESLRVNRFAINASGTGAGKTVMALASLKALYEAKEVEHCLVIAPKVSLSQWWSTADSMGIKGVLLDCINPEKISKPSGCAFYTTETTWQIPPKTLVIWDEPHRNASGVKSRATLAMAQLKAFPSSKLLAMSATLADSPMKLRALGFWGGMHGFNLASFHQWCRLNGCQFENINNHYVLRFTRIKDRAKLHMANIRKAFGSAYVAIPLTDIPNFPEQTLDVHRVDLKRRDQAEIERSYKEMTERLKTRAKNDMAEIGRCRERIEFSKAEAMAELALSHLSENKSVVIFCNFTSARERIGRFLRDNEVEYGEVYGGQKEADRQDCIDRFQANTLHAMIVMTAAGGAALSLHDTRHERPRVSLITPSFNAAEVRQALGRIRRCNGTNVEQYFVLAANTIEDRVSAKLEAKLNNIDTLNDNDLEV